MKYYFTLFIVVIMNIAYGQNEKTQVQISHIDSVVHNITENLPNFKLKGFGSYNEETLRYDSIYYYLDNDRVVRMKVISYGRSGLGKSRTKKDFHYEGSICIKYRYYHQNLQFSSGYRDENMAGATERITYIDSLGNCIRSGYRHINSTIGQFKEELNNKEFRFSYGMYCAGPQDEKSLKQIDKAEVIRPQKKK